MPTSEDNPFSLGYNLDGYLAYFKTRLVAITASSNKSGSIILVEDVVRALQKRAREFMFMVPKMSILMLHNVLYRGIDLPKRE